MLIDIHTHVINALENKPFTARGLLNTMNRLGIDKFAVLPIVSPETRYFYFGTEEVLRMYRRHPDRVIPFCNIDPRWGKNSDATDFSDILSHYKQQGCKGLGELTSNLYFDDPKCLNLYKHCGKVGFPVLFHLYTKFKGSYGLVDDLHLPRLENALKECPDTVFIGHAMAFWSEISSDVTEETRGGYPTGPVKPTGRVPELLQKYPNLYGDLSAGSGYIAITRDLKYGYKFLNEFQDKLLFGTDVCHAEQEEADIVPYIHDALKKQLISKEAYKKITEKNAKKILNL